MSHRVPFAILCLTAACLSPADFALAQGLESHVSCVEGPLAQQINYGDTVIDCAIDPVGDLDRFEFFGLPGDEVRITVAAVRDAMDPSVEVVSPSGEMLVSTSCNNGCSLVGQFHINDSASSGPGMYSIRVGDVNTNEVGLYTLSLERLPPFAGAQPVAPSTVTAGTIDDPTDLDMFSFDAEEGAEFRFLLEAVTDAMDPELEIRDPNGETIVASSCNNGCSIVKTIVPQVSGRYLILIADVNHNEVGSYSFQIEPLARAESVATLRYGSSLRAEVETPTDLDAYRFAVRAGTAARIVVEALEDAMDPLVEIRDPSGREVRRESCNNGCSLVIDLGGSEGSDLVDGPYLVLVSDVNTNERGSYSIRLECLGGLCPVCPPDGTRLPGDCNQDCTLDLSDALCVLRVLFLGGSTPCGEATSLQDAGNVALLDWAPTDGQVSLADAVAILNFLFRSGPPHPLAVMGQETSGRVRITGCP